MPFFKRKKKGEIRSFESETHKALAQKITDYHSYNRVKDRLVTDKAIRNFLYGELLKLKDSWSVVSSEIMKREITEVWRIADLVKKTLDSIGGLLTADNHDIYRHSTFFETEEVSEWIDVPVLYTLESEMILVADTLKERMKNIRTLLEVREDSKLKRDIKLLVTEEIGRVFEDVKELHDMISDRAELLASFEIVSF